MRTSLFAAAVLALSCGGDPPRAAAVPSTGASAESAASPRPAPMLSLVESRHYLLDLINRDRASMGLSPVTLDDGPAQTAGQAHAEEMAASGYLGHVALDGAVPEQRLTEAGGADLVLENASCFVDGLHRELDPAPRISGAQLDKTESMFFHETAPNDGHRKNILKPWHTKVAIGIAQPRATLTEVPAPCLVEEFLDTYGTYAPVPRRAHVGDRIHVAATIHAPAKPAGVGLARLPLPHTLSVAEANAHRTSPIPQPYETYWPAGFVTPIPVSVHGSDLAIDLPLSDHAQPGLYELSIWAKFPQTSELQVVGLRTIEVLPRPPE